MYVYIYIHVLEYIYIYIHTPCLFKFFNYIEIPAYFSVHVAQVEKTPPASAGLPSFLARCELRESRAGKEIIL